MPWGLSHQHKFIFIHIPKTAGTTICSSWEGSLLKHICKETGVLGGTHKSAMDLKAMFPQEWDEYFKFTVVRNPYDRFVSKFFFKQLNPRQDFGLAWTDKEAEGLLPQMYWITDRESVYQPQSSYDRPDTHSGNVIVDRLLRYENLQAELEDVFAMLGVDIDRQVFPHFRRTILANSYTRYFTAEFKSIVSYLYREDLQRLGYGWEVEEPAKREIAKEVIDETYVRNTETA